ncbi:MFS transporter [Enemella evansiae]|uniref:MFS transporter n=1 Tax=Enemella evansiae TaxID=2016499 RepID=UPI000B967DC9|nr:MFS transporter [Enemella evansiae]OYO01531.1 MFS transporter [Enemella evansiae]
MSLAATPAPPTTIRGVHDVIQFTNSRPRISGRAGVIWWLALAGLFLDAFSNSALSAGLAPMTRDLQLSAAQVALLTSMASWISIFFNPIGGWLADRFGRVIPIVAAKVLYVIGAALATFAPSFELVVAGRFFVGAAYGMDFAIAMALLGELTPKKFSSRINTWQGIWYTAVTSNLLLALAFYNLDVGDAIWRYAIGATGVVAILLFVLQLTFLVESPAWLARHGNLERAAESMTKMYGQPFVAAPEGERLPIINLANKGIRNVLLIFRGIYLPRTVLATTVQLGQSIQYFAVGWYLPVISLAMFGNDFVSATTGTIVFNLFGIIGGFASPWIGKKLGLRRASAIGFTVVFVLLVILGLGFQKMPLWLAFLVPSLFILFHSGGPGANGKSISTLSFRSELRAGANGLIGAMGGLGAALGLTVFPIFRENYGLGNTFLILAVVPLIAAIICWVVRWEPTRAAVDVDEEADAPGFSDEPTRTKVM